MRERIENVFPQCQSNGCLEVENSKEFSIIDESDQKCRIISPTEQEFDFRVLNPSLKAVYFLAIDKCLFGDESMHKKCDFALFDNQTFCFVEVKDTYRNRDKHKAKAKEQLKTTIELFKALISFDHYIVEAIISWRYRPIRPAARTGMQEAAVEFRDELNVDLLEGNKKEFL